MSTPCQTISDSFGAVIQKSLNFKYRMAKKFNAQSERIGRENFGSIINTIVDVANKQNIIIDGTNAIKNSVLGTADNVITAITGGTYKTFDDYIKNRDMDDIRNDMRLVHNYTESLIGLVKDPLKVHEQVRAEGEGKKILRFHAHQRVMATANKFDPRTWPTINPLNVFFAPNLYFEFNNKRYEPLFHRDPVFRQFKEMNESKIEAEYVKNSGAKFVQMGQEYINNIPKKHARGMVTEAMVDKLLVYTDPQQSIPDLSSKYTRQQIDEAVSKRIYEVGRQQFPEFFGDKSYDQAMREVLPVLHAARMDYDIFNYGVKNPMYYNSKDGNSYAPITKKQIMEGDNFNDAITHGKERYPSYLKMILTNNTRLFNLVNDISLINARNTRNITSIKHMFNPANGNDEGFRIRMNYIPTSKTDDMFGDEHYRSVTSLPKYLNVEDNMFVAREKYYDPGKLTFSETMQENLKAYKFYTSVVSDYVMTAKHKDLLTRNKFQYQQSNPDAYKSLLSFTLNRESGFYKQKANKKIGAYTKAYKELWYGVAGLAVACRLTGSWLSNRLGGFFMSQTQMSMSDKKRMKLEYDTAKNSKGIFKDIVDIVDTEEQNYAVKDKVSDVIHAANNKFMTNQYEKLLEKPAGWISSVAKGMNVTTDRLMNSMYGVIPKSIKHLSFSGSENMMVEFTSRFVFSDLKRVADAYMKTNNVDENTMSSDQKKELMSMIKKHHSDHKDFYYDEIKKQIGSWTETDRPLYRTEYLKNATNVFSISLGGMLLLQGVFKQISANNNEAVNRMHAGLKIYGLTDEGNRYNKGAYGGVGGAFIVALNSLYSSLTDWYREVEEDEGWFGKLMNKVPSINALKTVDFYQEKKMTINALKGFVKQWQGMTPSDDELSDMIYGSKMMLGITASRGFGGYESYLDESGRIQFDKKKYDTFMDIASDMIGIDPIFSQWNAFSEALGADDLSPMQRRHLINSGLKEGMFLVDQGNDMLKIVRDGMVLAREAHESDDGYEKFKNAQYAFKVGMDMIGFGYYMPRTPYKPSNNRRNAYIKHWDSYSNYYGSRGNKQRAWEARKKANNRRQIANHISNAFRGNYEAKKSMRSMWYNYGKSK